MKGLKRGLLGIVLAGSIYSAANADFDFNPCDPTIISRPDKWVQPQNLINPYNPLNPNSIYHDNDSTETYNVGVSTKPKEASKTEFDLVDKIIIGSVFGTMALAGLAVYLSSRD